MRQTFTIRFSVKDKTYKRDDYPFPNFDSLGHQLETLLEIIDTYPEDKWEEKFQNDFLGGLLPCEESEKIPGWRKNDLFEKVK